MVPSWQSLLAEAGIAWSEASEARLEAYLALIREYNPYASLVSQGDLARLAAVHAPDSFSLAPCLASTAASGGVHLDVGTGSGFPAVPIAIALPDLAMVLVERSAKKIGFLRQVQGRLGLTQWTLIQGEFPRAVAGERFGSITARAVERPERILKAVAPFIAAGAVFWCQSGDPGAGTRAMFHVEHYEDSWTRSGWRRGRLYRISAPAAVA